MGRFVVLLFALLLPFLPASVRGEEQEGVFRICGKTMCTEKQVCYNEQCEDNCTLPGYECPLGFQCNDDKKVCEMSCSSKKDCPLGMFCSAAHRCETYCRENVTFDGQKCEGTTPECFARPDLGKAFCGCVDGSCAEGMYCRNKKCVPCPKGRLSVKGQSCGCSPGSAASGKGYCRPCGKGQNCNCPKGKKTNGEGDCVTCITSDDCGKSGVFCQDAGTLTAACVPLVCRKGTYMQGNDCLSCPEGCGVCPFGQRCTECLRGYFMEESGCQSCAAKFGEGCGHCFISSERCEECALGYSMRADGSCQKIQCPEGTFLDGEECVRCTDTMPYCSKCTDAKTCLACSGEGVFWNKGVCDCKKGYTKNAETGECDPIECPYGQYYDINQEKCAPCSSVLRGCLECSSEKKCEICDWENNYLMRGDNTCAKMRCEYDSFPQSGQCKKCSSVLPGCLRCSSDGRICVKCAEGMRLRKRKCEPIICGEGTYRVGSKCFSCRDKFPGCESCDEKACNTCEKGYEKVEGGCRDKFCDPALGLFMNRVTGECDKCPYGYKSNGIQCEPIICSVGTYLERYECKQCPEHCVHCGNGGVCNFCDQGYGFIGNKRDCEICPFGSFLRNSKCVLCSDEIKHCVECSSDGKLCYDCGEHKKTVLNKCAE